jgi:hypothetical protein
MVEYKCNKCEKTFHQKSNYTVHINRKYKCDQKKAICEYCDKEFCRKSYLKTHIIKCKTKNNKQDIKYVDNLDDKSENNSDSDSNKILNDVVIDSKEQKLNKKKKKIPKTIKNLVWDTYIGEDLGSGPCYVCSKKINAKDFECGHIIAESKGGDITVDNLRPVCRTCNGSVGSMNMDEFKKIYFKSIKNKS